jgi:hypothetical protein
LNESRDVAALYSHFEEDGSIRAGSHRINNSFSLLVYITRGSFFYFKYAIILLNLRNRASIDIIRNIGYIKINNLYALIRNTGDVTINNCYRLKRNTRRNTN